jgi:ADP-ribosylglycohydrolase/fructose-1,6-bisphosphatase/inositol monophosphatase family enzyme
MHDYRRALEAATAAAREAGAILREGLSQPGQAREFDVRAEGVLRQRLRAATPWAYRSEEAGLVPGDESGHLWLVDPNDGTFHYDRGVRGSAVSIGLLRGGLPVLGVVFAFAFPDHHGDLLAWAEGCGPLIRNGRPVDDVLVDVPLDGRATRFDDRLVILLSPAADHFPEASMERVAPARYVTVPSIAYRLALVAAGEALATLSLNSPCGWDYAAGHALLRGAGGVFVDEQGAPISYTTDGVSQCLRCFAGGPMTVAALRGRPWTTPVFGGATVATSPARRANRVVADPGVLSRGQGCLLGQFAGDALGGLVEFNDPEQIQSRYPDGCRDLADGGTWQNLAGQPTDDSELALAMARAIVRAGQYDRAVVLDAYVAWWQDPQTFDRGGTIRRALSPAARVATVEERLELIDRHANRESQSNGSLMRISPVGMVAAGRPAEAAELARQDSRLTHLHPVCVDSCAVYVAAIAEAIATGCGPEGAYRAALAEAERSGVQPAVKRALEQARQAPPDDYWTNQGWALIALQNAFYQLLHAPSLEEGIVQTVMAGGDTDTTAAIAGALLGAVHGRPAVPARWVRAIRCCRPVRGTPTVHPRQATYWPVDVLELAEELLLARGSR